MREFPVVVVVEKRPYNKFSYKPKVTLGLAQHNTFLVSKYLLPLAQRAPKNPGSHWHVPVIGWQGSMWTHAHFSLHSAPYSPGGQSSTRGTQKVLSLNQKMTFGPETSSSCMEKIDHEVTRNKGTEQRQSSHTTSSSYLGNNRGLRRTLQTWCTS